MGGDAKQALAIFLSGTRQWTSKLADVSDKDVDICPEKRMITLPQDPCLGMDAPASVFQAGLGCTIPVAKRVDLFS